MDDRTLKMYVFYCSNSLDQEDLTRCARGQQGDELRAISLPCSGKVNTPYLVKAFEAGADGVIVVTCKQDECRHLEGNLRAQKRVQAVDSLLEEVGLGRGRITVVQRKEAGVEQIIREIEEFCTKVRTMSRSCAAISTIPGSNDPSTSNAHDHQEIAP